MECLSFHGKNLYCFLSEESKTNMYVLVEDKLALIVDPHI